MRGERAGGAAHVGEARARVRPAGAVQPEGEVVTLVEIAVDVVGAGGARDLSMADFEGAGLRGVLA